MNAYSPHVKRLANQIADTLNDRGSLPLYLQYAEKYKDEHLLDLLEKVMSIPERKIKKTRGALFTYLVSQYEKGNSRS